MTNQPPAVPPASPVPATPVGDLELAEMVPPGEATDPNAPPSQYWTAPESLAPDSAPPPVPGAPAYPIAEANAPKRRRWQFFPRTLTWRLVTGVVSLVIVVVVSAGVATYAALGSFLTDRLDQQVDGSVSAYSRAVPSCISRGVCTVSGSTGGSSSGLSASRDPDRSWFAIIDPGGAQLPITSASNDIVAAQLTATQRSSLIEAAGEHRTLQIGGESVRVTVREIQTTSGSYYQVVGLSTDEMNKTLSQLLWLEVIIGAGAVLIAFLATAFGVRLSLRPLLRVTNTARTVAVELSPEGAGLQRRVPVTDPDTEVGQLAGSVNTLLGAVETQFAARVESEQRMRQFMADASHELRTPLTSIRGYAELARMQRSLEPDPAQSNVSDAEALERIESEGTRMSRLVEDLLTLARGDIGAPIETQWVDVAEIIGAAVEGAEAAHPDRPFGVSAQPGIVVAGDPDQLLRVIRNLLTNAAVHTAQGRPIQISAVREGDQAVIQVTDSGPGLPPEQAALVFERFWRSDTSRARASGGSGLGLAIVASIVGAHHGTVRFDSSVEAGSVVTVTLPVG